MSRSRMAWGVVWYAMWARSAWPQRSQRQRSGRGQRTSKPWPSWWRSYPVISTPEGANRQRIAQLGASLVRHRSSPRHVGLNRHFLRGLVAVLSPLRPPGTSPWSVQPRPWSSFVAGVSPGDLLVFPWGLQHRLADALSRGSAQEHSIVVGSRSSPYADRKCLLLKMLPAFRLV